MGGSGKWIKSLITLKKTHSDNNEGGGRGRKWKLWRSASGGLTMPAAKCGKGGKFTADSEGSESSFVSDGALVAAMATLVRAPHRDFLMVKQEWAAIRIQTFFRAFLARLALRALRAVVRIQAIFRGQQVRKQAAVTLRCMQALVRVQARIRSHCGPAPIDGPDMEASTDPIKQAEKGWCSSLGALEELRFKIQMKQEGASRRDRAMAYAYSQLQPGTNVSSYSRANKRVALNRVNNIDVGGFRWLEQWTPNKSEDYTTRSYSKPLENRSTKTTSSYESFDYPYDDRATTASSISTCGTLGSSNALEEEEGRIVRPGYMNLTESIKAKNKQKASNNSHPFRGTTTTRSVDDSLLI